MCVGGGVDTFETKYDRLLSHPVFTCCRKSLKKSTMADHESVSCYLSGNNMGNVLHLVELIGQEVTLRSYIRENTGAFHAGAHTPP